MTGACLRCSVALLLLAPQVAAAQEEADWTAILLMSANYANMSEKLGWTGASADVNAVVLHDQDGAGMIAYRMLPDPDPQGVPGDCCPESEAGCCTSEPLDLEEIGIEPNDYIYSPGVLQNFLSYVAEHFPARHYLISARGQMTGEAFLTHNWAESPDDGVTIVEFADALDTLVAATGRKIDVVNIGLCLGGLVDWGYALGKVADYYVASANFTNEPVASRWRFYLWTRALIQNPAMTGRELAAYMPDAFALLSEECALAPNQCTNTNPPNEAPLGEMNQPWTCAAHDIAKLEAVASAEKQLVCAILPELDALGWQLNEARGQSAFYGYPCEMGYFCRPDIKDLALNIQDQVTNDDVRAAAAKLVTALDDAALNRRFQEGWFDHPDRLAGLSALYENTGAYFDPSSFGPFQYDSLWRLLMDMLQGGQMPPLRSLTVEPHPIRLTVGDSVEVTARGVSDEYGPLCAISVDWDKSGLVGATLGDGNPALLEAVYPGRGVLRATSGGLQDEVIVEIAPRPGEDTPNNRNPIKADTGCDCATLPVGRSLAWLCAALAALIGARRRR